MFNIVRFAQKNFGEPFIKYADREDCCIRCCEEISCGAYAKVFKYIKFYCIDKDKHGFKLSNKIARVEQYKKNFRQTFEGWKKQQIHNVRIFYLLNFDRKLKKSEIKNKIFFRKSVRYGVIVRESYQLLKNAGKELFYIMDEDKCFTLQEVLIIVIPLLEKIIKLHNMGYVHNDLKPSNILIQEKKKVNLIDGNYLKLGTKRNNYYSNLFGIHKDCKIADGSGDIYAFALIFSWLLAKSLSDNGECWDASVAMGNLMDDEFNNFGNALREKNNIEARRFLFNLKELQKKWLTQLKNATSSSKIHRECFQVIAIIFKKTKFSKEDKNRCLNSLKFSLKAFKK